MSACVLYLYPPKTNSRTDNPENVLNSHLIIVTPLFLGVCRRQKVFSEC